VKPRRSLPQIQKTHCQTAARIDYFRRFLREPVRRSGFPGPPFNESSLPGIDGPLRLASRTRPREEHGLALDDVLELHGPSAYTAGTAAVAEGQSGLTALPESSTAVIEDGFPT
jgi:hypothetical protein